MAVRWFYYTRKRRRGESLPPMSRPSFTILGCVAVSQGTHQCILFAGKIEKDYHSSFFWCGLPQTHHSRLMLVPSKHLPPSVRKHACLGVFRTEVVTWSHSWPKAPTWNFLRNRQSSYAQLRCPIATTSNRTADGTSGVKDFLGRPTNARCRKRFAAIYSPA